MTVGKMTGSERWAIFREAVKVVGQAQVARDIGISFFIVHRVFNGITLDSTERVLAAIEQAYVENGIPIKKVIRKPKQKSVRSMAWSSARIKRQFTLQELVVTIPIGDPEKNLGNLRPWALRMLAHGVFARGRPQPRRAGSHQVYRLARHHDSPIQPLECIRCGHVIQTTKTCEFEVINDDE